ncbi:MAG: phosphate transporter substrate-binding protein PstS, partial [Gemmataceae bacterium]|nr:phosphate transporter substrate-binding protein PstS [Gemmataceae bacterium]
GSPPPPAPGRRGRLPSPILLGAVGGAVLTTVAVLLGLSFGGPNGPSLPTTRSAGQIPPQQTRGPAQDLPARPTPKPADTPPPVTPAVTPPPVSPPAPTGVQITGSGSTFIKPAMDRWAELYEKQTGVKIKYDGIGSGRGIENMIDRVLDFGCTDAFMTDKQLEKAKATNGEVIHIPLAMGAVVATYNLPEVTAQLRFTGPVLADIYLGKIKTWNHPAIAASNPGASLPDLEITVIHRSDQSGTTAIWTDYLQKASVEWEKKGVLGGGGPTVKWPVGEEGEKNSGVAKAVSKKVGAVGYVELSFALEKNLKYAQVKNPGDRFVSPSLESVTAAANAALQSIPPDLRYTLTDIPAEDAYPIVGTTWAVLYLNQPGTKGKELVKFLRWAVHDGQDHLKQLNYARLPPRLAKLVDEKLAAITTGE